MENLWSMSLQGRSGFSCRYFCCVFITRDIDIAIMYVCLAVRDVPELDENGLTYCRSFFHRAVAKSFEFCWHQTPSRNSNGVILCEGDKYRLGIKIFAIFYQ